MAHHGSSDGLPIHGGREFFDDAAARKNANAIRQQKNFI
jgi:hypothetical protein